MRKPEVRKRIPRVTKEEVPCTRRLLANIKLPNWLLLKYIIKSVSMETMAGPATAKYIEEKISRNG